MMSEPLSNTPSLSPLKRAFLAIEDLQAKLAASENARREPIAIIGLGCRFPGDVDTPAAFWRQLAAGVDAVTEVPATRWPVDAFFDPDPSAPGRMSARHGGFLRDIEGFDAAYFGISPREAASMDPQHRLLLEVAWEALSTAGQRRERLAGSATGVFVGITTAEYSQLQLAADGLAALDTYHITGNALNAAAGRLAFVFGLHGPCLAVDTACSSSLVALHLACQSLRAGECETALAGGVNLILSPIGSIALSKGRVLSADGRAKTFDAAADGMVRGEGCGLLVLKRLSAAQRDGDRVLAVIRGSGVNQDGPSSGLTVPNGPAQEALLRHVLASAQLDPAAVDYIEAHGTGTALGDPIEVGALGTVYGAGHSTDRPLWIGSVKTNLGHLESAAGIAGVIKSVLALHHEAIPPHLHFKNPSPHIDWKNLPLRVPTALTAWPRGERSRYAAVSAFGFSGTNAHLIVGEAPEPAAADDGRGLVAPPTPFRRERFPLPRPASYGGPASAAGGHPLLGAELTLAGTLERRFDIALGGGAGPAWLGDHCVFGTVVVPATALLEMAHAAARMKLGASAIVVGEFSIQRALALPAATLRPVQTVAYPLSDGGCEVKVFGSAEGAWTLHASGRARVAATTAELAAEISLSNAIARCTTAGDVETLYTGYAARGLGYGPAFRAVKKFWLGAGESVAEIQLPASAGEATAYGFHPVLLDACFHAAGAAFPTTDDVFLPIAIAQWSVSGAAGAHVWCHVRVQSSEAGTTVDLTVFAPDGRVVARLDGLTLQRATRAALQRAVRTGEDWLYEIAWPEQRLPVGDASSVSGDWLIATDAGGAGVKIAERLSVAGATVTCVAPGELERALATRPAWRGVLHLGALELTGDTAPTFVGLGFESILALARTTSKLDAVWLTTEGAVALGGGGVRPAAAAVWGLGRVIAQEHSDLNLRLIDVTAANVVNALAAECVRPGAENQIAWRGDMRHAARLTRCAAKEISASTVRGDAAYLITGGLGALGLLAAGWLVERGARHVVLIGRTGPKSEALERIAKWTATGVRVETRRIDVADAAAVRALIDSLPSLRGIVHAAGAIDDGAARQLSAEQFTCVLASKAAGAWHLHQCARELDFFVLFSSAAAVLGTPGQANYASANAFLDGLAHARRAAGRPALSVNWGPWSAGMASALGDRYAARGIGSISPARGFEELDRLLGSGASQAMVMPMVWKKLFASLPPGGSLPLLAAFASNSSRAPAGAEAAVDLAAQLRGAESAGKTALLTGFVQGEVARVLRLAPEKLGADQPLNTLGLDSIMAVDLRNRVRLATGVELPLAHFLEGSAVATLVAALRDRLATPATTEAPAREQVPAVAMAQPLSAGQEALWFLHQTAPDSAAYHTAVALRLRGKLDGAQLRGALEQLLVRHPLLRARFGLESGQPAMTIAERAVLAFAEVDATGCDDAELGRRVASDYQRPYSLEYGALFRATLFRTSPTVRVLLIGVHHVVSDAWTNWLLLDEFRQLLAGVPLAPVTGTYAGFVRWQRKLLAGAEGARLAEFWSRELAGELTPLNLPTDFPRPPVLAPHGASVPFTLPAELWEQLRALARAQGATPFAVLLAAFHVLLHRHTGQDDLIVGAPTSGRSQPEFAGVAGYFVNPVPMRARPTGRLTFTEFLGHVRRTVLDALAHADYPLPLLVNRLNLPRDPSRPALFQTLFVYQKPQQTGAAGDALRAGGAATANWAGLDVSEFPLAQMEGQFELTLELFEGGGGSLKYNTHLFTAATVAAMTRRFRTLLEGIVAEPARRIDELPLLDAAERALVVRTWNDTPADYPQNFCLHELIAQQAARTPEAAALTFEATTLTYRELDRRANQLAHWLRRAGVRPDTLVGVYAERSLELVIALLGIQKSGGAYVPLDPAYPRDRLVDMSDDSAVGIVLTQERFAAGLADRAVRTLRLDADWSEVERESTETPTTGVTPDHLAYMIYTSGSTGRPKGACNTHRAIVNRLLWMQDAYRLTAADTVLQKTPFSFDVSVWEFFWPLLAGARLLVARPGGHQDAAYLAEIVAREKITTMHFVPSMLQVFVEEPGLAWCDSLRQVFCSGEALPFELQERFFARHPAELHNLYGPTEAAVDVTFWECERGSTRRIVPIGRPIARTQMLVLDRRNQPVPVGVAGELHIGGIGLARGYHRRPDLTAEKFVPDPFGAPGTRVYRTGDLARWLPDGAIEYLGRLDHQVKLRGFRIELGEIESAIAAQSGVRETVVVVREDRPGERLLIGYLAAAADATPPTVTALRAALRARLPDYMVPADFVLLPALPLSPNGKVDRRALPAPRRERPELGEAFVSPESPTERTLATLWCEVLGRDRVGVVDNFFDLGGHSLRLGQVHARLQPLFANAPALVELFQYPTIRALAAQLDRVPTVVTAAPGTRAENRDDRLTTLKDQRALRRQSRGG
jgi:amino acid adenylation domain-containing protein